MNDNTVMQRLIWKDIVSIKPLVVAAVVLLVAANLLLYALWRSNDVDPGAFVDWSIALWIIAPNLVAFGAPAFLIGSEEESGTIRWLRTLPIRWQQFANAKLWVAFGATAVVWCISSFVLWLHTHGWLPSTPRYTYVGERFLVSLPGVLVTLFCSTILLLLGMATAYLIRSPLVALLLLVPLFVASLIVVINVTDAYGWLQPGSTSELVAFIAVTLLSLWVIQRLLAWRRLRSADPNSASLPVNTLGPPSHYRPRTLPFGSKPSQVVSLLWQQLRQTVPLCLVLLALSAFLGFCFLSVHIPGRYGMVRVLSGLSVPVILLSASWFGAIVFYGDNLHRRCDFFADRGISPTRVWWTRIVPPAIACLLLITTLNLILLALGAEFLDHTGLRLIPFAILLAVLFAFGQLVSQWTEKPLLAFIAAPAYAFVSLSPLLYLLERYHASFSVAVITVPVLLLATWRLTGRWLDGRINHSYSARAVGYTVVAVLLPCLLVGFPYWFDTTASMIANTIALGIPR